MNDVTTGAIVHSANLYLSGTEILATSFRSGKFFAGLGDTQGSKVFTQSGIASSSATAVVISEDDIVDDYV